MTKLYSPSARGFYSKAVHDSIPKDVIEISDEYWQSLLDGQTAGHEIHPGEDGRPILRPRPMQDRAGALIKLRNEALASTDWLVARHRDEVNASRVPTLSGEAYAALQDWRQALRDLTKAQGFPQVQLPPRPAGI